MLKNKAKITIVISTYNRPDVLRVAIKSVILQTFSNWKILVIGDHCNQEIEKAVTSFNDARIKYINLLHRVGDQSGPNSVGIALAMTEYTAFMNQDDVWLQDHLEHAIETLEKTKSDFFIGKCGFAHHSKFTVGNLKKPIFYFVSPDNRTADMSFDKDNILFETASSWIIKTTHAKRIGYWKDSREIHRPQLQNWVIRAWRKKTKFVFGDKITVLKIYTHQTKTSKTRYSVKGLAHIYILDLLENQNSDSVREFVDNSIEHNKEPVNTETKVLQKYPKVFRKILFNRFTKSVCKYTGLDSYEIFYTLLGFEKGRFMKTTSIERTGKPLPEKVDIKMVIDKVNLDRNC